MIHLPRALTVNVSLQSVGSELLVYDEVRHQAFCLNRTSAAVFTLADGTRTIEQIASAATLLLEAPISEDLVRFALAELGRDGLLEAEVLAISSVSRRDLMRKLGAGAVMMVPVVAMVMAPAAAQAYSGCVDCSAAQRQAQRRQAASRVQPYSVTDPTFSHANHTNPGCQATGTGTSVGIGCQSLGTATSTSLGTRGGSNTNPFLP